MLPDYSSEYGLRAKLNKWEFLFGEFRFRNERVLSNVGISPVGIFLLGSSEFMVVVGRRGPFSPRCGQGRHKNSHGYENSRRLLKARREF